MVRKKLVVPVIISMVVFLGSFGLNAQLRTNVYSNTPIKVNFEYQEGESVEKPLPIVYGHVMAGGGISLLLSGEITDMLGENYGIGIGLPTWCYGVRGGFRNIVQVEYNIGKSSHDFNNNSILPDVPNEVVKMDYETKDIQIKFNPFFWKVSRNKSGLTKMIFLVAGQGDVEWRDEANDGFSGTSKIIGIEYAVLSKHISMGISFKKYDMEFDTTTLFDIDFISDTKASDYIFEIKVGFGFGI